MNNIAIVGDVHIGNQVSTRTDNYFETCLNKLEQVLQSNSTVIFLGDIFNTPVIDIGKLSEVYTLFLKYPNVEKITIIGNHEAISMNENSLYKTSLGFLELVGAIKVLSPDDYYEVGEGLVFKSLPLNFKDIKRDEDSCFFLGHHFYGLTCADSLKESDLKELFPNAIGFAFGHDHCPYPIEQVGNARIYRPGSLLRNAATDYNKSRKPFYYQTTLAEWKQGLPFRAIPIECEEGKDIFVNNAVIKKRERFLESLDRTIQLCSEKVDTSSKYSMIEVLKEIKTPRRVFEYINKTCNILGVDLK